MKRRKTQHPSSGLHTAAEIAQLISVDTKTIHNWADAGMIPVALRTGKTIRFDLELVKKALAENTAEAQRAKIDQLEARKAIRQPVANDWESPWSKDSASH
jgi:excisionase family DNA binding protein